MAGLSLSDPLTEQTVTTYYEVEFTATEQLNYYMGGMSAPPVESAAASLLDAVVGATEQKEQARQDALSGEWHGKLAEGHFGLTGKVDRLHTSVCQLAKIPILARN